MSPDRSHKGDRPAVPIHHQSSAKPHRSRSSRSSRSSDIPHINADDPLPARPEPETRWACPYISDKTNKLTVFTHRPLPPAEVAYGLQSCLVADDMARLKVLMQREDDKHGEYLRAAGKRIR